ncbi:murein biosynthesis integral membrane protein MurJ [Legionella israelensis]|uniref:Probable lipid II flippase MurJ n=1 Tax=Legionella israelensis TaxID=454 RepID=A0A0W0VUB7_9GAMM|nr:murein biosynthesis integral membrane protein MurJ [Legionella israelensis]KTD23549.1 integral membrane protein [Legionella israelensis]QBS09275.1 murein biosynthesis integral membrane protein MurJ [Legionella israelensis]SCY55715.1 putative peptidoglycan lipid II flippase [Legionella israelensis DSM 19235]
MSISEAMISKQQSLLHSTSLVSVMTLFSRLFGFVRDMVIAHFFGAQAGMDAFFVAFRIPNFMRRLFAEGAFSQAFVPVLAEYQQTRSDADVRLFLSRVAGHLTAVLSMVTFIGVLIAPVIIFIFAPGFSQDSGRAVLATEMLRLTFPYLMFISMTAMAGAVLNTYGYFGVPAFTPVLLNITMILAAVYLSPQLSLPVKGLAWGVLIAGIVQFLFQLPFLYQHRLLVKPSIFWGDSGVRQVLKLMVPALFGVSIAQINLMIDTIFASFLKVGSVSWLYYTDRLTDFPLGVFGVAVATVILPHLSRRHAEQSQETFSRSLDWALRLLLLLGLPAALGLAFFSMPLIASCFAYGKFSAYDLLMTQKSLITLALGVPAFMMVKVLASGFYACQDIKTPVKIGALAMVVNSILCALLIWPLAHAGLTLASSLAGYVNSGILLLLLIRRNIYQPLVGWFKFILQLFFASAVMSLYLIWMQGDVSFWLKQSLWWRLVLLLGHVAMAMMIYFICLMLAGIRPSQFRGQIKG